MIQPIHTLLVAEEPARPVLESLRRAGYDPRPCYVTTPEAFNAALAKRPWDVIIARHGLPNFLVWDALASLRQREVTTPFIVVADGLEEKHIVDLVQSGATDILRTAEVPRLGLVVAKAQQPSPASVLTREEGGIPTGEAFNALAEHMPIGLYRSTEDGRILYANPAFARMLERDSIGEMLGVDVFSELSYPREHFVRCMAEDDEVRDLEACWERDSGEAICTRENARAVRDEHGDLLYYEGTMEDITEERAALRNEQLRVEQLEAIVRFSAAIDTARTSEALNQAIVGAVEETLQAKAAVFVQREEGTFEILAWSDTLSEERVRLCGETEVWSSYPVHAQPLLLRDEQTVGEELVAPLRSFLQDAGLRALGSFPLLYRGDLLGMIVAFFPDPHTFTEGELRMAETLAWHVAVALSRWKAERELRESEVFLRTIADTTGHVPYRRRTGTDTFDYVSSAIERLTGYTEAELEAEGGLGALIEAREVVSGDDLAAGHFDSETNEFSALYHIRTKSGSLRWIEDLGHPWIEEEGCEAVGIVGMLQDVTMRRAREQASREQHLRNLAQQRAIFDLSRSEADPKSVLEQITEVAARTLETSQVGLWVMHSEGGELDHRDRYVRVDEMHEQDAPFPLEAFLADARDHDGSETLVLNTTEDALTIRSEALADYCKHEQIGALVIAPIHRQGQCFGCVTFEELGEERVWTQDEQGFAEEIASLVSLLVEHMYRARAEEALRSSELRYRAISELAADYACSIQVSEEGHTHFEWATKAFERISGYTPEEVADMSGLFNLIHEDDRGFMHAEIRRLLAGHTMKCEVRIRTKSGSVRWVSNRSRPVLDEVGRVCQVYSSGTDITERKEFEAELIEAREQAEEMVRLKSAFLANMSHEIRTPLTGILGFAGVLAEEVDESQREFAQLIAKSGRRLLDTLNSVLDLAQLESDGVLLEARPLDVVDETEQVLRLLQPLAEEKGVALELVTSGEDIIAPLDPTCLNRILHNLVGNAIKFTEQGTICVALHGEGSLVKVEVIDTGIGIEDGFLPHLFDEFKQESMGQDHSHEGSGLGLAITRKLVELMGGTISVTSTKGEGSTFTLSLPRLAPMDSVERGDGYAEAFSEPQSVPVETTSEPNEPDESEALADAESEALADAESETYDEPVSVESEMSIYLEDDAPIYGEPWADPFTEAEEESAEGSVDMSIDASTGNILSDSDLLSEMPFPNMEDTAERIAVAPGSFKDHEHGWELETKGAADEAAGAAIAPYPEDGPTLIDVDVYDLTGNYGDLEPPAVDATVAEAGETVGDGSYSPAPYEPPERLDETPGWNAGGDDPLPDEESEREAVLIVEDNDDMRQLIERVLRGTYEVEAVTDARTALLRMNDRSFDVLILDINLGGRQTGLDILRVARAIPGHEKVTAIAVATSGVPGDREKLLKEGFDYFISKPFTERMLLDALASDSRTEAARS